jgi:hypothetical protein
VTGNLNEELLINCVNDTVTTVTSLDPKVFKTTNAVVGDEKFLNAILVAAADVLDGETVGLNTNAAAISGKFKLVRFGLLNGVNTSAWSLNDILFIDPSTAGGLTNVKPTTAIRAIAKVMKVDALTGILHVTPTHRLDSDLVPVGFDRIWVTGDQEITTEGTFYQALRNDQGTVETVILSVVVADDSIEPLANDFLSATAVEDTVLNTGEPRGGCEFQVDTSGGQERITLEVYAADAVGVPIDSGILTEPLGTLGVRTVTRLFSGLLNLGTFTPARVELVGELTEDYTLAAGNRIRFRILCEKEGAMGGPKTFDVFIGNQHRTFVDAPQQITTDDVLNLSTVPGNDTTQALNEIATDGVSLTHADPANTGVLTWTGMTINGATQVDVDAGTGDIVDFYTNYASSTRTDVSWDADTITIPNLGIDPVTVIYVDVAGVIQTQNTTFTPADTRTKILLGASINNNTASQIAQVIESPNPIGVTAQTSIDFFDFTSGLTDGGAVSQTGDTGTNGLLAIQIDAMEVFSPGISWVSSKTNPNIASFSEDDPATWAYALQTGALDSVGNTLIDPTTYDNAGVATSVPTAGGGRRTTIQYVFKLFDGAHVILFGQVVYEDLTTAKLALSFDASSLVIPTYLELFAIPLAAVLVAQNCLDLADDTTAFIEQLGGAVSSGGGGDTNFLGSGDTTARDLLVPVTGNTWFNTDHGYTESYNGTVWLGPGVEQRTNGSGATLSRGDVVISASAADSTVTRTSSVGSIRSPGVVVDGGVDTAEITIAYAGDHDVFIDSAVVRRDFILTTGTLGQARWDGSARDGVFCVALETTGGAGLAKCSMGFNLVTDFYLP